VLADSNREATMSTTTKSKSFPTLIALCFGTALASQARADDRTVIVAETIVHSAPIDVAPTIARLHGGDRVHADDQTIGPWRRVALADGRYGFVRDVETQHSDTSPANLPVGTPPTAAGAASVPASPGSVLVQGQQSSQPQADPHLLGVMFELLPFGTLAAKSATGASASSDGAFAISVAPFFDGALSPYIAFGLSPQVVLRVKPDGSSTESAKEFDLRARLTARLPLSAKARAFARFSPAYSIIVLPSAPGGSAQVDRPNPQGFLVDVSFGTEVAVLPNLFLVTDIGYQAGFQSSSDGDLHTSYLHIGAGFAVGF